MEAATAEQGLDVAEVDQSSYQVRIGFSRGRNGQKFGRDAETGR